MVLSCPRSVTASRPVVASQILTVWSMLPVANRRPSGCHATAVTAWLWRRGPSTDLRDATSQTLAVRSMLAEAIRVPLGLHASP